MINIDDVRDFDAMLKRRIERFQVKLQDWLAPHRLTLADIRVHKVLIPMVGCTRRDGKPYRPHPGHSSSSLPGRV